MMAVRSGMTGLITELRALTNVSASSYTVGSTPYWSDDQLQAVLDRFRVNVYGERLAQVEDQTGAVYEYQAGRGNWEATTGGTAIFIVADSVGTAAGAALYTPDYARGVIVFAADTAGADYYLTGRSYDLNAAASYIWRQKASHYAVSFDFSTDNMSVKRGQLITNALEMAKHFERQAGPQAVTLYRPDVDAGALL